jgi:hypothetical protein
MKSEFGSTLKKAAVARLHASATEVTTDAGLCAHLRAKAGTQDFPVRGADHCP